MTLTRQQAALLAEQRAYYEARSGEYDEWWERRGRYDLGPKGNQRWQQNIRSIKAIFDRVPLGDDVLEPAAGTGNWTVYLAQRAKHVTVVEQSPSMIELNRKKLRKARLLHRVCYEKADLFSWRSEKLYDGIFLAFWISHVPNSALDPFLAVMASALRPGGWLVTLESQVLSEPVEQLAQRSHRLSREVERRALKDGGAFRIIKRYEKAEKLAMRLRSVGLKAEARNCGRHFQYAIASRPV